MSSKLTKPDERKRDCSENVLTVVPETQVPEPVHVNPAHCPHSAIVPPAAALVVVVVELVVVVVALLVLVALDTAVELVTDPPKRLITEVYAGLVEKSAFQRHASPSPENVDGIHEYLSVKSQTVIPTQFVTLRHAPTVFT
jgi:hypothetical protein